MPDPSPPRPLGPASHVFVGTPKTYGTEGGKGFDRPMTTSFFRQPIDGPVTVGPRGIEGDEVADKKHHGKPDQALLLFAGDEYPRWRDDTGLAAMGPGGFGENVVIGGITEADVCIGDRLRIGTAEFAVASPRFPCRKIDYRWKQSGLTARCAAVGRGGIYVRVIETGTFQAGDSVMLLDRPAPGVTLNAAARAAFGPEPYEDEARRAMEAGVGAPEFLAKVRQRLASL